MLEKSKDPRTLEDSFNESGSRRHSFEFCLEESYTSQIKIIADEIVDTALNILQNPDDVAAELSKIKVLTDGTFKLLRRNNNYSDFKVCAGGARLHFEKDVFFFKSILHEAMQIFKGALINRIDEIINDQRPDDESSEKISFDDIEALIRVISVLESQMIKVVEICFTEIETRPDYVEVVSGQSNVFKDKIRMRMISIISMSIHELFNLYADVDYSIQEIHSSFKEGMMKNIPEELLMDVFRDNPDEYRVPDFDVWNSIVLDEIFRMTIWLVFGDEIKFGISKIEYDKYFGTIINGFITEYLKDEYIVNKTDKRSKKPDPTKPIVINDMVNTIPWKYNKMTLGKPEDQSIYETFDILSLNSQKINEIRNSENEEFNEIENLDSELDSEDDFDEDTEN